MKLRIKGMYCNIIKSIYNKLIARIILNRKNWNHFLWSQEGDKGVHSLHSYSAKEIQIEKGEVKLSIFTDHMILYLKDTKHSTNKTLKIDQCIWQNSRIQKSISSNL
jgi:hypothetical protein